ncbi:hypothetical protein KUCAC02_021803, partial [Chaenocephalus aceratus]
MSASTPCTQHKKKKIEILRQCHSRASGPGHDKRVCMVILSRSARPEATLVHLLLSVCVCPLVPPTSLTLSVPWFSHAKAGQRKRASQRAPCQPVGTMPTFSHGISKTIKAF